MRPECARKVLGPHRAIDRCVKTFCETGHTRHGKRGLRVVLGPELANDVELTTTIESRAFDCKYRYRQLLCRSCDVGCDASLSCSQGSCRVDRVSVGCLISSSFAITCFRTANDQTIRMPAVVYRVGNINIPLSRCVRFTPELRSRKGTYRNFDKIPENLSKMKKNRCELKKSIAA